MRAHRCGSQAECERSYTPRVVPQPASALVGLPAETECMALGPQHKEPICVAECIPLLLTVVLGTAQGVEFPPRQTQEYPEIVRVDLLQSPG